MKQFIFPYILLEDSMKAAKYYVDMFQGEIFYVMYGKDTPDCPEDRLEEVMHLQLKIGEHQIYMSDHKGNKPNDIIQLHLEFDNKHDMVAAFNRFTAESKVIQELGETFWGGYFGVLEDKFGVIWQFLYTLDQENPE